MTRDMDLVRDILLRLEQLPATRDEYVQVAVDGEIFRDLKASAPEIGYHVKLLIDHGFILSRSKRHPTIGFLFEGLSWEAHDFVDSVRNDDIWNKTKAGAQRAGGWTFELLRELAKSIIKHELGKYIPGVT
ncbi:DUF2513 domain-containing protein [Bradyrhizobium roseum]|uniref:DUF2513 domain-containing protein n=1 Tax=Bradyrhizobium roseum TaxID=3056648 RepID=UPI00262735B6|nr:DUF2513 domain-containing protein [Bradyrhizobium roseus]WKA31591.1 DUF2513 domain-containing protein [Bradyrhizobium roseus]